MSEWARLDRLARIAVGRFAYRQDHADLLQEARITAWQHADEPDHYIVRACRFRAMDCLKTWHRDVRRGLPPAVPLDGHDVATHDDVAVSVSWGLAGRHAVIADGLASGERPSDIAAALGVHPSRVSQHIAQLRERV